MTRARRRKKPYRAPEKSAFQIAREATEAALREIGKTLEELLNKASTEGTPEHAELSVRKTWRVLDGLSRQVAELKQVREPAPQFPAPTRERMLQTAEPPKEKLVTGPDGQAQAMTRRFTWPVHQAYQAYSISDREVMAAARFLNARQAALKNPGTMAYENRGPAPDPAHRNPLTPADMRNEGPLAGRELRFIWSRLEEEFKAVVWVLVFQERLPGESEVLSPVAFAKRVGQMRSDEHARWYARGLMKAVLVRLNTLYKHYDLQVAKERELQSRQPKQLKTG
jgi:hypothetical protein